jgi:5-methylcytosine-specific restriction endonuclease McrA
MTTARELTTRLADLLRDEHGAMADFILALAGFDARQLWRELGHTSLFYFLRRELKLSAGAAQYRKTAAELVRTFPEVEAALRDGRLCLSTVVEVAKVLTPANRAEVLPRFFGLSRREAEAVAVSMRPAPVIPRREVVTPVRPAAPQVAQSPAGDALGLLRLAEPRSEAKQSVPPAPPLPAEVVKPLDADRSRYHLTVSRRFLAKLEAAKDALSHAMPLASSEEILEAGLDRLLADQAKRRGLVKSPRKTPPPSKSDRIPAQVRREVWRRSGGRCEWVLESGERCGSTRRVEVDHVDPKALGGPPRIENTRALCRGHNLLAARQVFGDAWMDRYTRGGSAVPVARTPLAPSGDQAGPP